MKVSVMVPHAPSSLEELRAFADPVGEGLADRLWLGQAVKIDPHNLFSALAASGRPVPSGTAVTLAALRHPYEAALQARSVATISQRSHVAGFGAGSTDFVTAVRGAAYERPLRTMATYLRTVSGLLGGQVIDERGEDLTMRGSLAPLDGPIPPIEVGAGVLRGGMARVAGRTAGCAITWLTPTEHIRSTIVPQIATAAARVGRAPARVVSVVSVMGRSANADPVARVLAASGSHLRMPHYTAMLQSCGLRCSPDDPVTGAAELISGGVYCFGDPMQIAAQLTAWRDAGVDEVALNVGGTFFTEGMQPALDELREVLVAAQDLR